MKQDEDTISELQALLRSCQREKREMFAKLSPACSGLNLISETCKWRDGNPHCTLRACPLLKKEDGK